jgi:hypothetical protein
MRATPFIGREAEMERLKGLLNKKSASLIVVRGRRRIDAMCDFFDDTVTKAHDPLIGHSIDLVALNGKKPPSTPRAPRKRSNNNSTDPLF